VGAALLWGLAASSSLLVGAVLALLRPVPRRLLGQVMGFGSGVLISAVAFELVQVGIATTGDLQATTVGLFAGSLAFYVGDILIERWGGRHHQRVQPSAGPGLAIVLGVLFDGVPESIVIGLTLLQGDGVAAAMVVAVFLSNLPESVAATAQLARSGWPVPRLLGLWALVVAASGLAAVAGYGVFAGASEATVAAVLGFAGGAILAMLADNMMPDAFANGGPPVGLVTTLGLATAMAVHAWW